MMNRWTTRTIISFGLAFAWTVLPLGSTARADFDITDFSTTTVGLSFPSPAAGQPNTAEIVGDTLQLTPGVLSNRGAVWTTEMQPLAGGFTTTFEFEFAAGPAGGSQCDGLALVIQSEGPEAIGDHAGAMGYGGFLSSPANGITKSLAVEIDDFQNGNFGDPNGNHISIHTLGVAPNTTLESASIGSSSSVAPFGLGTGSHTLQVEYDPVGTLTIYLNNLLTPIIVASVDLTTVLDGTDGHIGFTGSGGASFLITNVRNWSFTTSGGPNFRRGDINHDGTFDVSDVVFGLAALFIPGSELPECGDSSDANDDGTFDVSDAVYALAALFIPSSPLIPDPGSLDCGADPTTDALDCAAACP